MEGVGEELLVARRRSFGARDRRKGVLRGRDGLRRRLALLLVGRVEEGGSGSRSVEAEDEPLHALEGGAELDNVVSESVDLLFGGLEGVALLSNNLLPHRDHLLSDALHNAFDRRRDDRVKAAFEGGSDGAAEVACEVGGEVGSVEEAFELVREGLQQRPDQSQTATN